MTGRRCARGLRRDHGFTLIESLVAMMILLVLFAAFATAMMAALNSARINRTTQAATAIGVDYIEFARSLEWAELAMSEVNPDAPLIDAAEQKLLAGPAGLGADEALVSSGQGALAPRLEEGLDDTTYTVWTYVSEAGTGLRRVMVYITWQTGNASLSHRASTLVAEVVTR